MSIITYNLKNLWNAYKITKSNRLASNWNLNVTVSISFQIHQLNLNTLHFIHNNKFGNLALSIRIYFQYSILRNSTSQKNDLHQSAIKSLTKTIFSRLNNASFIEQHKWIITETSSNWETSEQLNNRNSVGHNEVHNWIIHHVIYTNGLQHHV